MFPIIYDAIIIQGTLQRVPTMSYNLKTLTVAYNERWKSQVILITCRFKVFISEKKTPTRQIPIPGNSAQLPTGTMHLTDTSPSPQPSTKGKQVLVPHPTVDEN